MSKNRIHYSWVMVILSAVILGTHAARFYTFGIFLIPLTERFEWSRGSLSIASSMASIVGGILSIPVSGWSDKYGPRVLVTVTGVLNAAGLLLMSRVGALWQVYLVWGLVMGTASACAYVPLMSTIARWFATRRTTAIGITIVGFAIGAITWPVVTQAIISTSSWQTAFIVLGITNGIIIIPLAQFLRGDPQSMNLQPYGQAQADGVQVGTGRQGLTLREAIRTGRFWLWGPIILCFFTSLNVLYVHIVPHARDIGIPPLVAASTLSIIAGSSIIARLSIGTIADRIGIRPVLCGALLLVTIALTLLVTSPGRWSYYLFAVIFGLGYGSIVPLETAIPAVLFGTGSLGAIMAAAGMFPTIGGAFGPPIAGAIFDASGRYQMAFLICLMLAVIALVLSIILLRLKDSQKVP